MSSMADLTEVKNLSHHVCSDSFIRFYSINLLKKDKPELIEWALDLTRSNMKKIYELSSAIDSHWKWSDTKKLKELRHKDSRFLFYFTEHFDSPRCGFISWRFELYEDQVVAYIWELQVSSDFQRRNIGTKLVSDEFKTSQ